MSIPGVRSNRGDVYQTLIALDWVMHLLQDTSIRSIEVDATATGGGANPSVDDVIVSYNDGSKLCIQCKKNETDFKAWTVATLKDELVKAALQLSADARARVRFCSQSPFGELGKLREAAQVHRDPAAFAASLTPEHAATVQALRRAWASAGIAEGFVYEFLHRTEFVSTASYDDLERQQIQTLTRIATSPAVVYESLWKAVDQAGARIPSTTSSAETATGVLTRADIHSILKRSGSTLAPLADQAVLATSLRALSQVGRFWQRGIGGARIERAATATIMDAISTGTRSILLTGGPGSGKSCVLLDVADLIEREAVTCSVYVQGRSFAATQSAVERKARGLRADFVSQIARMAEFQPVIVIFDSLDVLSLGREHGTLAFFLALIDQLLAINNVAVLAAARSFDAKYDSSLATRTWGLQHDLADLDWETEVMPRLVAWNIDEATLAVELKSLLRNPRHLALFHDIQARGAIPAARSHHELTRSYLDVCIRGEPTMGAHAVEVLEDIAGEMLHSRTLEITRERARLDPEMEAALCSVGALQRTDRGHFEFTHQTLLDVLAIGKWERKRGNLATFIDSLPPVPFVRPAIRAYVLHLAASDRKGLRAQLRGLVASELPHHIRRLLVETFADLPPQDDDWPFVNALRRHSSLFDALFGRANTPAWKAFWLCNLAPLAFAERLGPQLLMLTQKIGDSLPGNTGPVLEFWTQILQQDWLDRDRAALTIGFAVAEQLRAPHAQVAPLMRLLLNYGREEYDALGSALMRAVEVGAIEDDLLWEYMTSAVDEDALNRYTFDKKLRCDPHVFGEEDRLAKRMVASDRLLDLAIDTLAKWIQVMERRYQPEGPWHTNFLNYTSWEFAHTNYDMHHVSSVHVLFRAIEKGVMARADSNVVWWQVNADRLAASRDAAQRYWCVTAITRKPAANLRIAADLASQERMLTYSLSHEVGDMINATFLLMTEAQQEAIFTAIQAILLRHEQRQRDYDRIHRAQIIQAIPAGARSPALQAELDDVQRRHGNVYRMPGIHGTGGGVAAPFDSHRFLEASDDAVLGLLAHYDDDDDKLRMWGEMIGGPFEVGQQLHEACSRAPSRFLALLADRFHAIPKRFRPQLLDGAQRWTQLSTGDVQKPNGWASLEKVESADIAIRMLDELERHPAEWSGTREAANALRAAAPVLPLAQLPRLAFQLFGFLSAPPPTSIRDLITTGINSTCGNAAEAAIIAAVECIEAGQPIPDTLRSVLEQFAGHAHPAVRAVILRRLPYFTSRNIDLGWAMFESCIADEHPALLALAEQCLYHAYAKDFARVEPILARMRTAAVATEDPKGPTDRDGDRSVFESWARISALASLSGHIAPQNLVDQLLHFAAGSAWHGALTVWSANAHLQQHHEVCFEGLRLALKTPEASLHAAHAMDSVFRNAAGTVVPADVIALKFQTFRKSDRSSHFYHAHQYAVWLDAIAATRPDDALAALEMLIAFVTETKLTLHDNGPISRVLTTLFRDAEEREAADKGAMLKRMVSAQDALLSSGMYGLDDWLRAAERP